MTDAEVEKILRSNKYHRLNYLMALEIPTSDKYTHVWFYDVLQCMAQKVVEFNYEREKIDTIKNQLKAVKMMQFGDVKENTINSVRLESARAVGLSNTNDLCLQAKLLGG